MPFIIIKSSEYLSSSKIQISDLENREAGVAIAPF
jgi:hypothetical protein